jgi:hypothetical protein
VLAQLQILGKSEEPGSDGPWKGIHGYVSLEVKAATKKR